MWQSANRMLGKSVHKFRESLHEGVKVATLLKDDVDEGVSKLGLKKNQHDILPHNSQQEVTDEQQVLIIIKIHEYHYRLFPLVYLSISGSGIMCSTQLVFKSTMKSL